MNTRLAVATHILTLLHTQGGKAATSEYIAASVNTNASFIRRLLTQLAKAGLTTSQMGAGGGALLARAADQITLLDVYEAVNEGNALLPVHEGGNPLCPVGRSVGPVISERIAVAEAAFRAGLSRTTIEDMASGVAKANA